MVGRGKGQGIGKESGYDGEGGQRSEELKVRVLEWGWWS